MSADLPGAPPPLSPLPPLIDKLDRGPAGASEFERLMHQLLGAHGARKSFAFEPMIGMVTSPHHVFLATGVRRVQEPAERDEGRFAWVALADIPTHIERGKILNSGTLVGLLHVLAARGRKDGA